jgi:outer membrane protein TolC
MKRGFAFTTLLVCLLAAGSAPAQSTVPSGEGAADPLRFTLREAVEQALAQNPDVQIANLSRVEAEAGYQQTRSQLLPQWNASIIQRRQTTNLQGIGLIFPGFPDRIGPFNAFDARPQLAQTVLDFGAWQSVRAAKERIAQAGAGAEATRQATALSVISFYLQAVELESRIAAGRSRIRSAEAVETQVKAGYEAGTASKLDFSRAVLQKQSEVASLKQLEGALALTRQALLRFLGQRESAALQLTDRLEGESGGEETLEAMEREAIAQNPELAALRHAVSAARAETRRARLQRMPRLSFVADYGVNGRTPSASLSTYQIAGVAEFPIFTSGRIGGEIKAADARLRSAEEVLRRAELRVLSEARGSFAEWSAAKEGSLAAEAAVAAARENLELSRARYEAGVADSVSVLQAQASLADLENLAICTKVNRELARARLWFAAGNVIAFLDTRKP